LDAVGREIRLKNSFGRDETVRNLALILSGQGSPKSDSSWNREYLCAPRWEAVALERMVKREVLTRQQVVALIQFTEADQRDAVRRGIPAEIVKSSADYRDVVLAHFLDVIEKKQPVTLTGLVHRNRARSQRKDTAMDTKSQQPRPQPNPNDGPTPEQVVTGQRCASCRDRATHA